MTQRPAARAVAGRTALPAIGLEAEFATSSTDAPGRPEDVFGSPAHRARPAGAPDGTLVSPAHRRRRVLRHGRHRDRDADDRDRARLRRARHRSLWESIRFLRDELDAWEARTARTVRLVGLQHALQRVVRPAGRAPDDGRTVEAARLPADARARRSRDAARREPPLHGRRRAAARQSHRDHRRLHAGRRRS